ncbi:MAG: alcohol dehydrogenase catalytic domain-containing protein [Minisyncoccia bacterium]
MSKKMLAAVFTQIGHMEIKEVDQPEETEDNIIVKVDACGICGSDVRVYFNGSDSVKPPWILGHEVAGTVVHIGKKAEEDFYIKNLNLKINDKIILISTLSCGACEFCRTGRENLCINKGLTGYPPYPGGYAQYMPIFNMQFKNIFKIPENLSPILATLTDPLSDAIHGANILDVNLGSRVLIIGSGPIGTMLAALSHLKGASEIFLTDISNERLNLSKNALINFDRIQYIAVPKEAEEQEKYLKNLLGDEFADRIIVASPSMEAQEYSLRLSKKGAKIVYFGGLPPSVKNIKFESNILHYGEQIILGSYASKYEEQKLALKLILKNMIPADKIINHISPLEKINESFNLIRNGKVLKVVVIPNEGR